MSDVTYEEITVANVNDLKLDDEIFYLDAKTGLYVAIEYNYGELLDDKVKMDRAKADELVKAKEQDKMRQSNYDATGPIGAPQALAFVLAQPLQDKKYQYKLAFFKLYKKKINIITNANTPRYHMENSSSGVETKLTWGYVALFVTLSITHDDDGIKSRFSSSQFLECPDSQTFNAGDFFRNATSSFQDIGTPIGLISFDMTDNITYEHLSQKYTATNFKNGKWVIPVRLSNPKCIYASNLNCGSMSGYTVAPNQNATDQNATLERSNNCRKELNAVIVKAENNNKSSWFTFKKTRMAKIEAEIKKALNGNQCAIDANVQPNDTRVQIVDKYLHKYPMVEKSKQQSPNQIQLVNYDVGELMKQFTHHPNAVFFIDPAPDMDLGNLVLLVANECKVGMSKSGGKRTLRSHKFKKTKNKKHKKYGTSRRGERHKCSMRRKRSH